MSFDVVDSHDAGVSEFIDVQQSNAMVCNRLCRKTDLPLVGLVALLF
jgi:hypothetical protein